MRPVPVFSLLTPQTFFRVDIMMDEGPGISHNHTSHTHFFHENKRVACLTDFVSRAYIM